MTDRIFVPGLELSRLFYEEVIRPQLAKHFPTLTYGAGLLGDGSEVLGFDTELSTDHDWGPRLHLFLKPDDFTGLAPSIVALLDTLPVSSFRGYPMTFHDRDRCIGLDPAAQSCGSSRHGVEVFTVHSFFHKHLNVDITKDLSNLAWLGFPEQILLSLSSGIVLRDDTGELCSARSKIAYFPQDIWLYLLACQWTRIAQEQAFVGRSGIVGDELGSTIIGSRLIRDLMRLCFLMERKYAPYSKWFGAGFSRLSCYRELKEPMQRALSAETWKDREAALCACYQLIGRWHADLAIPAKVSATIDFYHQRPFRVVNADDFVAALRSEIQDPIVKSLPGFGSIDQISDNTDVLSSIRRCQMIREALVNG